MKGASETVVVTKRRKADRQCQADRDFKFEQLNVKLGIKRRSRSCARRLIVARNKNRIVIRIIRVRRDT